MKETTTNFNEILKPVAPDNVNVKEAYSYALPRPLSAYGNSNATVHGDHEMHR